MYRRSLILGVLAALMASLGGGREVRAERSGLLIGTGAPGGVYYPLGDAICHLFNFASEWQGMRCAAAPSAGSVENIAALRAGRVDLAIVQSDVLADAVKGEGPFEPDGPWPGLRAVFAAHDEPFTIVVRPDAAIVSAADLRGKRINIGAAGSGQRLQMEHMMAAIGLTRADFAAVLELDPIEQVRALCDGRVNAIVYAVGHPSGLIQAATRDCGGRIVPAAGDRIRALIESHAEYGTMVVPGGLYAGSPVDVPTFGPRAILVATDQVPAMTIYELVKSVFDGFDEFVRLHPAFGALAPERMARTPTFVPVHAGAVRFFQERGWAR